MQLPKGKKIYFASDFHLGIPDRESSREREKVICKWLNEIKKDAYKIYLLGDLFDVWFEYKNVIPKGFSRFFGAIASLKDEGVIIEVFTGNHDLWMKDYFVDEFDIPVHYQPIKFEINDKKFFIGHGDGLGPGDHSYKFLKKVMTHPLAQWLYRRIHPDTGIGIANYFSRKGPKHLETEEEFLGEKEWLVQFSRQVLENEYIDYFLFGHRHLAIYYPLNENSVYVNLGDWINFNSYVVFDGKDIALKYYK